MWVIVGMLIWLFLCGTILAAASACLAVPFPAVKHGMNRPDAKDPFAYLFEV
ncbi:hypothetical protein [Paenibacillus sp. MMS20-IR301]|uniref:hypothetical protein n=1 Tax=Paenibacillus sp. MMS20-IR301 TaxID=2895946 RepID=UPI0028E7921F|nr:hypothetical protein [Paenibacillus sp. MMS20-IR301]WNS44161.1 hypothetical protein LOS79_02515 [Paenibacillus sp. MMS20-IR301]